MLINHILAAQLAVNNELGRAAGECEMLLPFESQARFKSLALRLQCQYLDTIEGYIEDANSTLQSVCTSTVRRFSAVALIERISAL
jgi:hypothetical protein